MSVYQSIDGTWIFFDGVEKHTGLTETEAYQMAREADYVEAVIAANKAIWDGIHTLGALQDEWNALDYGNTLDDYQGYTAAEVGAVVFAVADAFVAVRDGTLDSEDLPGAQAGNMAALL